MKTAWITGANKGIGAATAIALAWMGYQIVLHYGTDEQQARQVQKQLENIGVPVLICGGDISNEWIVTDIYQKACNSFSHIDVLVNNAGISQQKLFTDTTLDEWKQMMDVHVTGTFLCSRLVLPDMISRRQGKIINLSSIWGIVGSSCEVAYSTAKSAIIGMTKALAKEVALSNVQVNCVAPGAVDTQMMQEFTLEEQEEFCQDIPLGRMATPQEIASTIAFLCKTEYMTGQVVSPNGGIVM